MFGGFHPFGDHLPSQLMREDDDGLHDGERIVVGPQPLHERLIDLEERNRRLLQIAQGRIPRAEIIQARLNPLRIELLQSSVTASGFCIMSDSVISILRLRRIHAGGQQHIGNERRQIGECELVERKIYAHGQRTNFRKLRVPERELSTGLSKAPFADLRHQPQFHRHLQEPLRLGEPRLRMLPAQQRLKPGDMAGLQGHDRLIF